jgi:hypothetical protein
MKSLGLKELFFTSDSPATYLDWGSIPGGKVKFIINALIVIHLASALFFTVLQTANFQSGATQEFKMLQELQPNMPLMVTEFWSGWLAFKLNIYFLLRNVRFTLLHNRFDHWTQDFRKGLKLKGVDLFYIAYIL